MFIKASRGRMAIPVYTLAPDSELGDPVFLLLRTMDSAGMLFALLCVSLLSVICNGQVSKEVSAEDTGPQNSAVSADSDLVSELFWI